MGKTTGISDDVLLVNTLEKSVMVVSKRATSSKSEIMILNNEKVDCFLLGLGSVSESLSGINA